MPSDSQPWHVHQTATGQSHLGLISDLMQSACRGDDQLVVRGTPLAGTHVGTPDVERRCLGSRGAAKAPCSSLLRLYAPRGHLVHVVCEHVDVRHRRLGARTALQERQMGDQCHQRRTRGGQHNEHRRRARFL